MRSHTFAAILALLSGSIASAAPRAAPAAAPKPSSAGSAYVMIKGPKGPVRASLFSGEHAALPIARVEGEVVTLADFTDAVTAMHEGLSGAERSGKKNFQPVLDRLIATRLIAVEAMDMGLDELPEVKKVLDAFATGTARDFVKLRATDGLRPDAAEVEQRYREATRQHKVRAVLFPKADDAQAFVKALQGGGDFGALAGKAIADKKATGDLRAEFLPRGQALPEVLAALAGLDKGATTGAIATPSGNTVLQVVDTRYEEDPAARRKAEAESLARVRQAAIKQQGVDLAKKWAKVDEALLASLDFEAPKPGFAALARDGRALATLGNKRIITVAEFAEELKQVFFHGIEGPIKEKRVNSKKAETFNVMLQKAVYDAEAAALGIGKDPDYQHAVRAHRATTLFGTFVERALVPGLALSQAEVKKHYDGHRAEFSFPAFYRLFSLGFTNAAAAKKAADKLRAGTDFKWLRANADEQLPEDQRAFDLQGSTITQSGLTPQLARALAGAKTGDVRTLEAGGKHYVVWVQRITPPAPRPFEEVRDEIAKKLEQKKLGEALDQWVAKARRLRKVEVYISRIGS